VSKPDSPARKKLKADNAKLAAEVMVLRAGVANAEAIAAALHAQAAAHVATGASAGGVKGAT
jgi:hypothetical protein